MKPSHWASAYINMAARKGIISGFADGKFKPGQTVTAGQAVTILMRGLGYKDEDMGGVWPRELHGGGPDQRPFEVHWYHLRLRGPDPRTGGQARS